MVFANRAARRGILMLVVVSLLTLLLVVGLMFAIVAGQARRASSAFERAAQVQDDPEEDINRVLFDLIRGPRRLSSLSGHDLLGDLYGYDGTVAVVTGASPDAFGTGLGEFYRLELADQNGPNPGNNASLPPGRYPFVQIDPLSGKAVAPALSPLDDYYNGRVLTFLDGPLTGFSTRVVDYEADINHPGALGNPARLGWIHMILELPYVDGPNLLGRDQIAGTLDDFFPRRGDRVLINGVEFNGTGAGYLPATGNLDQLDPSDYAPSLPGTQALRDSFTALLPNHAGFLPANLPDTRLGGVDESYDVADYQNMLLASNPPGSTVPEQIVPSLHRPMLVRYWFKWLADNVFTPSGITNSADQELLFLLPYGTDFIAGVNPATGAVDAAELRNRSAISSGLQWPVVDTSVSPPRPMAPITLAGTAALDAIVSIKRKVILRPLPEDHPNFAATNRSFWEPASIAAGTAAPLLSLQKGGHWDVDNNNDGIKESIWVDPGLPVATLPDGRRVKKLVAIYCQDLDGLPNINSSGSLAHVLPLNAASTGALVPSPSWAGQRPPAAPPGTMVAESTTSVSLARGFGYGPAEIQLGPVFSNGVELQSVLVDRYGPDGRPGVSLLNPRRPVDDLRSYLPNAGMPYRYGDYRNRSAYSAPPDVRGWKGLALDLCGNPLVLTSDPLRITSAAAGSETDDDPYEVNHSGPTEQNAEDTLFTLLDLEAAYRRHDIDGAQLSSRLLSLAPTSLSSTASLRSFTTESRHIPVAAAIPPRDRREPPSAATAPNDLPPLGVPVGSQHLLDLYRQRLRDPSNSVPLTQTQMDVYLQVLVPPEIRAGKPLDVNRPFGNGRDDNGNGVVDEPLEVLQYNPSNPATRQLAWLPPLGGTVQPTLSAYTNGAAVPFFDSNGTLSASIHLADRTRSAYARHLYCLAMLLLDQGFVFPLPSVGDADLTSNARLREYTARRLAQWAVNVVDSRDPDSIMTAFEYDVNPWNGWDVNGTLNRVTPLSADDTAHPERRVVWGNEGQHLLMTECIAFHDRRVRDTRAHGRRGDSSNPDDDLDQYRIPQGSLFLELFNPESPQTDPQAQTMLPAELYDRSGQLDLARLAPPSSLLDPRTGGVLNAQRYPVWRVAVSEYHGANAPPVVQASSPLRRSASHPATSTFHPGSMSMLPQSPTPRLMIDRYIWFTATAPTNALDRGRIFYNTRGWPAGLAPNRYAVVGPRPVTELGAKEVAARANAADFHANQRVILQRGVTGQFDVELFDLAGGRAMPSANSIQLPLSLIADMPWTGALSAANQRVGLSVTEPLLSSGVYYREPNPMQTAYDPPDAYDDPAIDQNFPDEPFDRRPGRPLADQDMLATATYNNCHTAFLQRLADPTLPHNPDTGEPGHNASLRINPYVTVDWAVIDVTVFNGEEDTNRKIQSAMMTVDLDPDDPQGNRQLEFETRQRGSYRTGGSARVLSSIWPPVAESPQTTPRDVVKGADSIMKHPLFNTFGYLNSKEFRPVYQPQSPAGRLVAGGPLGYQGASVEPSPWVTVYNRPFMNPLEVLIVPASSPARLGFEVTDRQAQNGTTRAPFSSATAPLSPYDPTAGPDRFYARFNHLLNFFHVTRQNHTTGAIQAPGANLFRVLDYLETRSPYVGAEKWISPTYAAQPPSVATMFGRVQGYELFPPFNRLSRFRDPGRINLNTLPNRQVASCLFPNNSTAMWSRLQLSRAGMSQSGPIANWEYWPSRFNNPFRHSGAADLMPDVRVNGASLRRDGVEATLLRPAPDALGRPSVATNASGLFEEISPDYLAGRNAYLNYRELMRLKNLSTTNSNLYAVWVTLGYFEAEQKDDAGNPIGISIAHPDGYRIGREVGSDTGEVVRHRGFAIIDRSIPVGYQPGENLNVERVIRLRRFIE